jgi:hypothetical protein
LLTFKRKRFDKCGLVGAFSFGRRKFFCAGIFSKKKLDFQKKCDIKRAGKVLAIDFISLMCASVERSGNSRLAGAFSFVLSAAEPTFAN